MNPVAKTITSDVVDRLNSLRGSGHYLDKSSIVFAQIKRQCDQIRQTNADEGWLALGIAFSVVGDVDEMRRCFDASLRLTNDVQVKYNYLASLLSLRLAKLALPLFSEVGNPEFGYLADTLFYGMSAGGFQVTAKYIEMASAMKLNLPDNHVRNAIASARILSDAGISDIDASTHIDAAGSLLREKRIFEFRASEIMTTDVDDVDPAVTMVIYLNSKEHDVFAFNLALAEREAELSIPRHPSFDVVFAAA